MPNTEINLSTIGNGAANELFERELGRILANIKDVNTSASKKRKLQLIFEFSPYNDRSGAAVEILVKSDLSATTGVNGTLYISRVGPGVFRAFTQDMRQTGFDFEEEANNQTAPQSATERRPS